VLLRGRTAVVYGAEGAIGAAVARAFAQEGARLAEPGEVAAPEVCVGAADAAGRAPGFAGALAATATAMADRGSGAVVLVAAPSARAAVEALARDLAAELGPRGLRVVCVRAPARHAMAPGRAAEALAQVADVAALSAALAATARTARA
jgi:NAD(P)-dependent dehydrogenase (short-subunit alcohol dehydrogenase family)